MGQRLGGALPYHLPSSPDISKQFLPRAAQQLLRPFLCPELGSGVGHCKCRETSPVMRLLRVGDCVASAEHIQGGTCVGTACPWAQYSASLNLGFLRGFV